MNLFVNYFKSDERPSCLNLAAARFILCLYGAWKVATYPYVAAVSFPEEFLHGSSAALLGALRWPSPGWMLAEQSLAVGMLLLCAVGLFRAVSSFGAAFLITHMAGLAFAVENEKTAVNVAFFLIFYGIFRHADSIGLDDFLQSRHSPLAVLNKTLRQTAASRPVALEALKWFLVALACIYFFTGFSKWQAGGWSLAWGSWENIRLAILNNAVVRTLPISPLGEFLVGEPLLLGIAGYGTLLLELGFLFAVLAGLPITPFLLGLAGMHAVILLAMRVNYFTDMVFLYTAFFAWDALAGRMQSARRLMVVYDENCSFCIRVLLLFQKCDVTGGLRFVGPRDPKAPKGYDYHSAMFVFDGNGTAHRGYEGFVALFSYLGLTRPLAWILATPPIALMGRAFYAFVARNRFCVSGICRTPNHHDKN